MHFDANINKAYICRANFASPLNGDLSILLVLDPNWQLCYDNVKIDTYAKEGVLRWVAGLRDALTIGPHNPDGDFLMACHLFVNLTQGCQSLTQA